VLIYGIGLGDVRKSVLKELAEMTGGRSFFVAKAKELAEVYRKIADELRRQYYLSYSTDQHEVGRPLHQARGQTEKPGLDGRARARLLRGARRRRSRASDEEEVDQGVASGGGIASSGTMRSCGSGR
jgi:hypothetical protein